MSLCDQVKTKEGNLDLLDTFTPKNALDADKKE